MNKACILPLQRVVVEVVVILHQPCFITVSIMGSKSRNMRVVLASFELCDLSCKMESTPVWISFVRTIIAFPLLQASCQFVCSS